PGLQKSIGKMTTDDAQTEEIIQETFIKIWLSRDQLSHIENIEGYLYRTAVNLFLMRLRQQTAQREREKNWAAARFAADESALDQVRIAELKEIIQLAVDQLPEKRREIYRLSRDKGMTTAEIAAHLQIAESTVKNSISAALTFIRERLIEGGYDHIASVIIIFLNFFCGQ
ncbi:MAG: sigma-70 family RNA polymerase sigma factor, partial [Chitinophagaceae bacterium]|nr:sigma-70 family RNA polymerase sigma factor [Chitinophagaceae bacterium]